MQDEKDYDDKEEEGERCRKGCREGEREEEKEEEEEEVKEEEKSSRGRTEKEEEKTGTETNTVKCMGPHRRQNKKQHKAKAVSRDVEGGPRCPENPNEDRTTQQW